MPVWSLAVILVLAAGSPPLQAQDQTPRASYRIDTVAGSQDVGDNGPATAARLSFPWGVAADGAGNFFIADHYNHRIRKVDSTGVISTVAGTGRRGFGGDGGPATEARLDNPSGVAVDGAGNLFIADVGNHRIRMVDAAGVITTVAGSRFGFSGDGGPAVNARLDQPDDVAVDGAGNLFIADWGNHRIRMVDPAGVITTIAGTGERGFSGDGGQAVNALLGSPRGVAADGAGNLFIADISNNRIRKVDAAGVISTVAGTGERGFGGDGGPAVDARVHRPSGVVADGAGNLFIVDWSNDRVRKVDSTGVISTVAGTGRSGFGGDGGPATEARLDNPRGVAVDGAGNLFIADQGNRGIRKVDAAGVISTVAGTGEFGFGGDGGPATIAWLNSPDNVAVDDAGNLLIGDEGNHRIRKVDAAGVITTVAGSGEFGFGGDGGPAVNARLDQPDDVAVDGAGNLFIADRFNNRIRKVDATGVITTVAGSGGYGFGSFGFGGDSGPATAARLNRPSGVAVDGAGNLFIADGENYRIRKVDASGVITTVAGTGESGFSGDGGPAVDARVRPSGVVADGAGNLFIVEWSNNRIRKVDSTGVISTVAGTGERGFGGDGGPAVNAQLNGPSVVAVDGAGNLFIAESGNDRIRRVDTTGTITTIAGTGEAGFSGDGGPAVQAQLNFPAGVAVDGAGNLFIADAGNDLVRKLTPVGGSDTPPAGTESFSIPDRGGQSVTSNGTETTTRSGYGRIRADAGRSTPAGIAIFGFRQGGVLVAEAGVPASEPVQEGRIFAEVRGPVNTGLAMANPNDMPATILFYFRNAEGERFGDGQFELGAHEQTAKFLNQEPFNSGNELSGTFTFTSSQPIAVIALRGLTNRDNEFLMTTLPVAPLASTSTDTVYFPHFTDGDGWVTQVILVNPTDDTIAGNIQFVDQGSATADAAPAILTLDDDRAGSEFSYSIPAGGSQRFTTSNPAGGTTSGSVRATPDQGSVAPSGLVVFSFTTGGKTVSEVGVNALTAGSAFRVYAESSGTPNRPGSIRTGLAITNAANAVNTVTLDVTGLDGAMAIGVAPVMLTLPPSGQVARFLDEIFDSLPENFSGILRVTSTADVAIVGLRLRINERGELKMTTTPPSDETRAPITRDRYFAHIVDSAGWSTQFILFSGTAGQASSGTLSFIDTAGAPWNLPTTNSVSEGSSSPPNDQFSNAQTISGPSGTAMGSNVGATDETGEPGIGSGSVWW